MSKVVRLRRIFRDRLELSHRPSGSDKEWRFELDLVYSKGRRFVGSYVEITEAFAVALAWRDRGVPTACIDRSVP